MDGDRSQSSVVEEPRHEVGVPLRDAETERALRSMFPELFERILAPSLCRDCGRQSFLVEMRAAPRDIAVVDVIRDAKVMKRRKEILSDAFCEITAKHEVL